MSVFPLQDTLAEWDRLKYPRTAMPELGLTFEELLTRRTTCLDRIIDEARGLVAVAQAAKVLVESVTPGLDLHAESVDEAALTALEAALENAGYGSEPPEDDGECFRGADAAGYLAEQQAAVRRLK